MAATVGSINVRFGADLSELTAKLAKGEKRVGTFADRSEKGARRSAVAFAGAQKSVGNLLGAFRGAAMASAIGGLLSITGAIAGAKNALAEFDKVAKAAKLSGLNSDLYQSLVYSADLAGVAVGDVDKALQSFRRNSALAASDQGTLYTVLKKVNPELLKQVQASTTQEQKLRIVSNALKEAKTETDRVAIATAAFGRNGQALIPVLSDGEAGLTRMQAEAKKLGIVIDRDLLARSEELTDQLSIASKVMDVEFKSALIDLAPVLVDMARIAGSVASGIRSITDAMRGLEGKSTQSLKRQLDGLNKNITARQNPQGLTFTMPGARSIESMQAEADQIRNELKRRTLESMRPQLEALKAQNSPTDIGTIGGSGGRDASTRDASAQAAIREAEAVTDLIADLQAEYDAIGMTDTQRRIAEAQRRAGTAATSEQSAQIAALVTKIEAEKAAIEASNEMLEARKQAIQSLFDSSASALESIIDKTKTAGEAFRDLAIEIAKAALQGALLGQGPLAGLFGGGLSFGGGGGFSAGITAMSATGALFHGGGDVGSKPGVRIGHKEVVTLLEDETVFTRDQTEGIYSALSTSRGSKSEPASAHVTVGVSADNNGNLKPFVESVTKSGMIQVKQQVNKEFQGNFHQAYRKASKYRTLK